MQGNSLQFRVLTAISAVGQLRPSHFLMRGLGGTHTEISLAVMAYNLTRMVNIFGGSLLTAQLLLA